MMPQLRSAKTARDTAVILVLSIVLLLGMEAIARRLPPADLPPVPPRQPGDLLLALIGGSSVAGVPEGRLGFVTQLELGLRELGAPRPVAVWNLGQPGRDSTWVRRSFDRALREAPDLVVVLSGHNEFLETRPRAGWRGGLQRLRDDSALVRLVTRGLAGGRAGRAHLEARLRPVDRDGPDFRAAVSLYEENLDAMLAQATGRGVPVFLCTAPANLSDWPPARGIVPGGSVDGEASALFREARALRSQGRIREARQRFHAAKERDPYPLRALDVHNDAVRSRAAPPGVRVVDLERIFAAAAPGGLVGFPLICDNCHPSPLGGAVIAHALARAMSDAGLLLPGDAVLGAPADWLARAERLIGGPPERARVKLRWMLANALYAMKRPFLHYDIARRYLTGAREIAPDDWRVAGNLGVLALLEGDLTTGRGELARATRLRGARLEIDDHGPLPDLDEALERSGQDLPSLSDAGGS